MVYISGSASVSSSYSNRTRFKSGQDTLAAALDNKYLKRQTQIEMQQRHQQLEMPRFCFSNRIYQIRNKNYTTIIVLAIFCLLCFSFFFAGWLSASYASGALQDEETRSLQELAESIRRMRLRRHQTFHQDNINDDDGDAWGEHDGQQQKRKHHQHPKRQPDGKQGLSSSSTKTRNELLTESASEEGVEQFEKLEEKIRETQQQNVKQELMAKRLDDKMAESIQALKQYAGHDIPKEPDIEQESFT